MLSKSARAHTHTHPAYHTFASDCIGTLCNVDKGKINAVFVGCLEATHAVCSSYLSFFMYFAEF